MSATSTPDERAELLASRQHGAISLTQALDSGLTTEEIKYHLSTGRWRRRGHRVFTVTAAPSTREQAALVACLAGPPGTVASHLTAAALFGLCRAPDRPHVTVPKKASARNTAAHVHRSDLAPEDRTVIGVIPCTRPARIVVDAAAVMTYEALCELVDDVLTRPLASVKDLRGAMARAGRGPGRKGMANLNRALEVWTPGRRGHSRGEMRLIRRLSEWGIPLPERQIVILDGGGCFVAQVDTGWRDRRFLLEYDGGRYHGPRQAPLDAARQKRVEALGWRVERVRKDDLRPGATRLRAILNGVFGP